MADEPTGAKRGVSGPNTHTVSVSPEVPVEGQEENISV